MIIISMDIGKLRYHALWAYTAILSGMVFFDKLAVTPEVATAILAPIAVVVGADIYKHREDATS